MNRPTTAMLLISILLLPALLSAAPLPVNLGVPFALGPGQSAEVIGGDLYFVFTEILADSRCPMDVVCVWEGDAEAAVVGDLPGEIQINCVLHTSAMFTQSCDMGTYRVFRSTSTQTANTPVLSYQVPNDVCHEDTASRVLVPAEEVIPNPLEGFHGPTLANPERTWTIEGGDRIQ